MTINVLTLMTPKNDVEFLYDDYSLRQALEKMEVHQYQAIPIITRSGAYLGTVTEGDLLWFIKQENRFSIARSENITLAKINLSKKYQAVSVLAPVQDIFKLAIQQNYIPVIDDQQIFIGIIRRQTVMRYLYEQLFEATT